MSPARDALRETFAQLDALRATERRVAMATLVTAKGATPRKEGAKMWVGEGGRILGAVTIGGCIDARVVEESEGVLADGAPRLVTMSLSDADAWEIGFTCGGEVEVLIEPVSLTDPGDPVMRAYDAVRAARDRGHRAVMIAPLGGAIARYVIGEDETRHGTLGSVGDESFAAALAIGMWEDGASRVAELGGSKTRYFFELHAPPSSLIVFGAGHVSIPLIAIAHTLGWRTLLVDARERYATRERFPEADEIRTGIVRDIAASLTYDKNTSVVLTAHDYKFEVPVLREVLRREAAYIGLLGSRKRGRAVLDFLAQEGYSAAELARVHVPVGLDLGAETAAEIAVATAAEIIAARNHRSGAPLSARA